MKAPQFLIAALCVTGIGWGLTTPLSKIAVSGSHPHFALLTWNLGLALAVLAAIGLARRRLPPLSGVAIRLYGLIAVVGVLVPFLGILAAAERLPGGVLAVVMGLIPMLALGFAMLAGRETAGRRRLAGLVLGFAAVAMLTLPGTGLPDRAALIALPLALIAPVAYALEGTIVDLFRRAGADPLDLSLGSTVIAFPVALALCLATGGPVLPEALGPAERAVFATALLNTACYLDYLWLIGRAGPVFAAQLAYIEVAAGVFWSGLLLGERYPGGFWLAMALMIAGLALVRPRAETQAAQ